MLKIRLGDRKYEAAITGRKSLMVAGYQDEGMAMVSDSQKTGRNISITEAIERECELVCRLFDEQFTLEELYDGYDADKNGGKTLTKYAMDLIESLSAVAVPKAEPGSQGPAKA